MKDFSEFKPCNSITIPLRSDDQSDCELDLHLSQAAQMSRLGFVIASENG